MSLPEALTENKDNLLTAELAGYLITGERSAAGHLLYPYIHAAVRYVCGRYHLSGDVADDLEGEAFLYVLRYLEKMQSDGQLHQLNSAFLAILVRNCHFGRYRGRRGREESHEHYDDAPISTEYDSSYTDPEAVQQLELILTVDALRQATERLDKRDRQTIDLYQKHYRVCENELEPGVDTDSPGVRRSISASAIQHLALSLKLNQATVYRRLDRAREHLAELLEADAGGENRVERIGRRGASAPRNSETSS